MEKSAAPTGIKQDVAEKEALLRKRLRFSGVVILVAGLIASALVYVSTAPNQDSGAIGYAVEGGSSYAIAPSDSKQYNYEMERLEGKSGVAAAEFMDWFNGLWHGRKLASTLAVLSVGGCAACFLFAHLLLLYPPLPDKEGA